MSSYHGKKNIYISVHLNLTYIYRSQLFVHKFFLLLFSLTTKTHQVPELHILPVYGALPSEMKIIRVPKKPIGALLELLRQDCAKKQIDERQTAESYVCIGRKEGARMLVLASIHIRNLE